MRYFIITHADGSESHRGVPAGSTPEEMGIDVAHAVEAPRRPRECERWNGAGWEMDNAEKAARLEDARLRTLRPSQRQAEAVAAAVLQVQAQLGDGGGKITPIDPEVGPIALL